MIKRLSLTIASLALAAVLLLNFQAPDEAALTGSTSDSSNLVANAGGTGASNAGTSGSGTSSGGTAGTGSATGGSTAGGSSSATATGTYAGSVVMTRYGPVQVQVTVQDGRVTDVQALQLPSGGHSGRISQIVAPMLQGEALAAQSASISIVSGATFTSVGYANSLQSALDAAGL